MAQYNVVVVNDNGDDIIAKQNAHNQIAAWSYARGIRWAVIEMYKDNPHVYVATIVNGEEVERIKVLF